MSIAESTTQPDAAATPIRTRARHHRDGFLRARHGNRAAAPGCRLRHPGEGRRHRRHLARQQLPRLRLRRAVAPLLVLVRAESRPGASCSRRSRRSWTTSRASPKSTACAATSDFGAEGEPRALGRRRIPLARVHRVGRGVRRAVPDLGRRRAAHPAHAGHRGHETNSAAPLSIPRSGTTAST